MNGYELEAKIIEDGDEDKNKNIIGKIGGNPTYLPDNYEKTGDYFLMEIYNNGIIKNEDVIGWQIYQDMDIGGIITEIIEIKRGARLNEENIIPTRRWIDEYYIYYEEKTWKDYIPLDEIIETDQKSMIYGNPGEDILEECKFSNVEYFGIIYDDLCPYDDLRFGYSWFIIGMNEEGKLVVV